MIPARMATPADIRKPTNCQPPCWMAVRSASLFRGWAPFTESPLAWITAVAIEPRSPGIRNLFRVGNENRTPYLLKYLFISGALMADMKAMTKPTIRGTQGLKVMSGCMPRAKAP